MSRGTTEGRAGVLAGADYRWLASTITRPAPVERSAPASTCGSAPPDRRSRAAHECPKLMPIFPVESYMPRSRCPHYGPIPRGSVLCCMVCHQSGQDHHPAMQPDAPAPIDHRTVMVKPHKPVVTENRRQRRRRLFRDRLASYLD
jgi:hypothetical protein